MNKQCTILWCLLISGLSTSCRDSATSPIGPRAGSAHATSTAGAAQAELRVEDRFDLDIEVAGSLKPGQPIHLTLRGTARFATGDAEVRLSLPEVAAAERSSWQVVELPVGEETPPHIRLRRAFSAAESFRERTSLTIPEPGYYFVIATAKQHSIDSDTDRPNLVGDVSGKAVWLWIDEHGGRVTERFDTTLFDAGTRKERGPRGSKYKPPRLHRKDAAIACTVYPELPGEVTLQACGTATLEPPSTVPGTSATHAFSVIYDKAAGGHTAAPVPQVRYLWRITAQPGGTLIASGEGNADANGNLPVIDCRGSTSERNVVVDVYTLNDRARVTFGDPNLPAGRYTGSCGGSNTITANMYMSQLFINLLKTVEGHYRAFGTYPDRIPAALNQTGETSYHYQTPEVRIYASYRMVFGEYGVFVAAHEWGHMWQDRTLYHGSADVKNGLMRYYDNSCPLQHPPESKTNFGCALGEAFADWYAVLVRASDLPTWKTHLESNYYYRNCYPGYSERGVVVCTDDGAITEGALHAFLWDLSDGSTDEPHDRLQFTPATIANVVKGCLVHPANAGPNQWIAYNGADHLIWCMDGRSPYEMKINGITSTFFNARSRSVWADDSLGPLLTLRDDRFRRLWLVNLYSKRVGDNPVFTAADEVPSEPAPEPNPEPEPCYSTGFEIVCPTR
jgi:hypothetical protein